MSISLDALVPELRGFAKDLIEAAGSSGLLPRVTSTRRTHSEQIRLYARFLAGHSLYPTAFPGTSAHEYGEAFDMLVTPYEALEDVGYTWQVWGGTWGGAADPIHFELPGASRKHQHRNIALVADLIVGMIPGISEVELGATLLQFGFPESEILRFLSSPIETITQPKGTVPISYTTPSESPFEVKIASIARENIPIAQARFEIASNILDAGFSFHGGGRPLRSLMIPPET